MTGIQRKLSGLSMLGAVVALILAFAAIGWFWLAHASIGRASKKC